MRGVKSKHTRPELRVRSLLHRAGYRFRLHLATLPGKPDLSLVRYRTAIFVNGCFWHHHAGCAGARIPDSNREFWEAKIHRTVGRDGLNLRRLEEIGWRTVVVWECELRDEAALLTRLDAVLRPERNQRLVHE